MTINDREYTLLCLILSRMSFLTFREKLFLSKKLDSLYNLVVLSIEDISIIINRKSKAVWDGRLALRQAEQDLYILEKFNISMCLYTDKDYPVLLKEISDPPFLLFYRGDLGIFRNPGISVVGTRKMTADSAAECLKFSKEACLDGVNVISGLAFGIDRKAHEGALSAFDEAFNKAELGKTAAVIPGGIDRIVPEGHKKLACRILEKGGCILSEYPPGEGAMPFRFVQRNRIIAGLSPATVVIQAPPGSGAMLTAEFALGYDREVVFHEVNFRENSRKISLMVKKQLEKAAAFNRADANRLMNDPELYVNDGAPVIQNYADFKRCLFDGPVQICVKKNRDVQMELFSVE